MGGAHEGQPGFTVTLFKAVLLHQRSNERDEFGARAIGQLFSAVGVQQRNVLSLKRESGEVSELPRKTLHRSASSASLKLTNF